MKIIYATNNLIGSKSLLDRIRSHIPAKTIGYSYLDTDLTIDSIDANDIFIYKDSNQNTDFKRLYNQLAYIKPDLVISELNLPITYIASLLNIETYQVSPLLFYFALENKLYNNLFRSDLKKIHRSQLTFYSRFESMFSNLMFNSNKLFIYHYINDIDSSFTFDKKFIFVKPYIITANKLNNEITNNVINTIEYKKILNKLPNATVVNEKEFVTNAKYIQPYDADSYSSSLNCNYLYNSGETSVLADGIYNKINTVHRVINTDIESNMNSLINKRLGICNQFYIEDEIKIVNTNIDYKIYNNSKYLHEYII